MRISQHWLGEWITGRPGTEQIKAALTRAGLEVDSIDAAGPNLDHKKIVIAEILDVAPHPDADRLTVCRVDVGKARPLTIVCGAPNTRAGMKTVAALHRARLPQLQVMDREIRGVKSRGMLCSGQELGIDDSAGGIMEFDPGAETGRGIADYLRLDDPVFTLEVTPNRGDCLGVRGIARELATLLGGKLKAPGCPTIKATIKDQLSVQLKAPQHCPSFTGRAIRGIDMNAKTPDWMAARLQRCGMRTINAIVDITNYVMHELGQPMHAFDLNKIHGGIRVRLADAREQLALLDGSTVTLSSDNLVIADHDKAIALAGIMGGANTAISDDTADIYFEAAFFAPEHLLGKARRLGLHTEASHRFERGVDSRLQTRAMERATELVLAITGGQAGPVTQVVKEPCMPEPATIDLAASEISRVLGITVPEKSVTRILQNLGLSPEKTHRGWRTVSPTWRFDLAGEHDIVEEIGRCHGYENIPPKLPVGKVVTGGNPESAISEGSIRQCLAARGFHEAITYSFVDPVAQAALLNSKRAIKLQNPIASNMAVMRQSLWPGLLEALRANINRQHQRVRLFEIGHTFAHAGNSRKSTETNRLAGIVCGSRWPEQWGVESQEVDFFDLKSDLQAIFNLAGKGQQSGFAADRHPALHPGQTARVFLGRRKIGWIGKLHPQHQSALDIDPPVFLFEIVLNGLQTGELPCFRQISKFPSAVRDLAVLVDDDKAVGEIAESIRLTAGSLLVALNLFDIYRGGNVEKGKKSLAFGLTFQSESSNLASLEIDVVMDSIITTLRDTHAARLRS